MKNLTMSDVNRIRNSLLSNLKWFENSGVMDPADGRWGVGERVVLTKNNPTLSKVYREFPFYVEYNGYAILEHRRADCNFQAALLYWLAAKVFKDSQYHKTAENLLMYLFCRSGMRNLYLEKIPVGIWQWSMPQIQGTYWLDDNSWNCLICLILSAGDSALEKRFSLRATGLQTADALAQAMTKALQDPKLTLPWPWLGTVEKPHWTGLVAMALSYAYHASGKKQYADVALECLNFLESRKMAFNSSENAYYLLGTAMAAWLMDSEDLKQKACQIGDHLCSVVQAAGNFPSECASAPAGKNLVDLVYTQNWATLGFQVLSEKTNEKRYGDVFDESVKLIVSIQDTTPEKHLQGCWRGLYDMERSQWGGGDCFEGGASSIYTGWTNAPIAISLACTLLNTSLLI